MTESNRILAEQYKEQLLKTYKATSLTAMAGIPATPTIAKTKPEAIPASTAPALISSTSEVAADSMPSAPIAAEDAGFLMVNVTTARGALPIVGAHVSVTDTDGALRAFMTTDISGKTHAISLPTPPGSLSEIPDSAIKPYASYNVRVTADGYYPMEVLNVPVFATIQSNQPIDLVPLMRYEKDPNRTMTYTTTEPNL